MADLDKLQETLGYRFRNPALLQLAMTHPSVAHEQSGASGHNQRLEFLGDAVLQLILTRALFNRFPDADEGMLTKSRAQLVNQVALEAQSRRLGLGDYVILSKAEEANGGRQRPSILADAFEALLGAIYIDGGFDVVQPMLLEWSKESLSQLDPKQLSLNPKGQLQEWVQARSTDSPVYKLESVSGPDHDRWFECSVWQGGVELARGFGRSKKHAEGDAAQIALKRLQEQSDAKSGEPSPNPAA